MDEEEKYLRDVDDDESDGLESIEAIKNSSEAGIGNDSDDDKITGSNMTDKSVGGSAVNGKPVKKNVSGVKVGPAALYRMIMLVLTGLILIFVICNFIRLGKLNKEDDVAAINEMDEQLASESDEDDVSNGVLDTGEINDGDLTLSDVQAMDSNDIIDTYLISKTSARKNDYKMSNFIQDEDYWYYEENGEKISRIGVDVSSYQGDIDWRKVKKAGMDFAIIRVGIRGYGSGKLVADEKFETNVEGALAEGLEVGVYFFSQAITEQEAVEEAEFVDKLCKKYDITLPIAYDSEKITSATARTNKAKLTAQQRTQYAIAFCDYLQAKGYKTSIYSNKRWFLRYLDLEMLDDYNIWLAQYSSELSFPFHFGMWQYTDSGRVDGIDGKVDIDIYIPGKE